MSEYEKWLAIVYVMIATIFLLHLVYSVLEVVLIQYYQTPDPVAYCDFREMTTECFNWLQSLAEFGAASLGTMVATNSNIFQKRRSNQY